jgi:hypothetical protein
METGVIMEQSGSRMWYVNAVFAALQRKVSSYTLYHHRYIIFTNHESPQSRSTAVYCGYA